MEDQKALIARIYRNFVFLADEVRAGMNQARSDIVGDAIKIFRELLNLVYGFELKEANSEPSHQSAGDLIDMSHSIAIEITTANNIAEIKKTKNLFEQHDLEQGIHKLWILILDTQKLSRSYDELKTSGYELKIMNLQTLCDEMEHLSLEKLGQISEYLSKTIGADVGEGDDAFVPSAVPDVTETMLDKTQRQILALASLLPKEGLHQNVFTHGLDTAQRRMIPDLLRDGLLYQNGSRIGIHPDHRTKNKDMRRFSDGAHTYFLEQLWHYDHCWHWDRVNQKERKDIRESLAHVFAMASEHFEDQGYLYRQRSAELWLSVQAYNEALENGKYQLRSGMTVEQAEWDYARALDFVGTCYNKLENYYDALHAWQGTLALCGRLKAAKSDHATALHKVACAHRALNDYAAARKHLLEELKIREKLRKSHEYISDQPGLKEVYSELSAVFADLGDGKNERRCFANAQQPHDQMAFLWEELMPHLVLPLTSGIDSTSFYGRESELQEIRSRFNHGEKMVVLSGLGGMGKTELAVRYGRTHEGKVYFTRFSNSFTETIAGMACEIRPPLSDDDLRRPADELCRMVLDLLAEAEDKDLLIIDQVESATGSFDALRLDPAFQKLSELPIRLLLTTRHDAAWAIFVSKLPDESLFEIFRKYGVDISEQEMRALIGAVDGHVMTIDLMARTLNRGRIRKITPDTLLSALRENTLPEMKTHRIATDYNQSVEKSQIYQHLSALFNVSQVSDLHQDILRFAVLLPEEGLSCGILDHMTTEEELDAFEELVESGWLMYQADRIKIHPVIRLVCRTELRPADENCGRFLAALDDLCAQWDGTFYDAAKFAQLAEVFTTAADNLEDGEAKWIVRAGKLLNSIGQYDALTDLYERHLGDLENQQANSVSLARVYSNLGYAYGGRGQMHRKLEFQLRALEIYRKCLPEDHRELMGVYDDLGVTYSELGDYTKALDFGTKAMYSRAKYLPSDHLDLAASYNHVGYICLLRGEYEKASEYLRKALRILVQSLPVDHPNIAAAYNNVGYVLIKQGNYSRATDYLENALKIRKEILSPGHPDLAVSYNDLGKLYIEQGKYSEASEYLPRALEIWERSLPSVHPNLAYAYTNAGKLHGDLGNKDAALEYHQKALSIMEQVLPSDHPNLAWSCADVAWDYHELSEYQDAAHYMRQAANIISHSSLPSDHPDRKKIADWADQFEEDAR